MIYCEKCGIVPVNEKDLPVLLPEKIDFRVSGNPLANTKEFVSVKCPKCGKQGKRETDTMGGFVDSSWYFLRFCDNKNKRAPFDKDKVRYWIPVDQYIGGAEHAVMHLMYARFFVKVLKDLGFVKFDEPFTTLFNQGMLHGEGGAKMSKSLGNTLDPMDIIGRYGADSLRMFLVSVASPDSDFNWSDNGMQGSFKFLTKLYNSFEEIKLGKSSAKVESKANKTIKEVSSDIENFRYNLAIIKLRGLFDFLNEEKEVSRETTNIDDIKAKQPISIADVMCSSPLV
jgi:leucyl-tRNA synthetase